MISAPSRRSFVSTLGPFTGGGHGERGVRAPSAAASASTTDARDHDAAPTATFVDLSGPDVDASARWAIRLRSCITPTAHAFDIIDSTSVTVAIIAQTLDFMARAVDPEYRASIVADAPLSGAAAAYTSGQWSDAVRQYGLVAGRHPNDRIVRWRLGLSQLENADPANALSSFDRAGELGQGGARDIGLPATRASSEVAPS